MYVSSSRSLNEEGAERNVSCRFVPFHFVN
jgi:hypothetical protein